MDVKICPKCKAQNRATNAACSSCYASLDGVAVTQAEAPQLRIQNPPPPRPPKQPQAAPPTQQMPPASPLQGPAPTQQFGPPQQTQIGSMPPPPGVPAPTQAFAPQGGMPGQPVPGQGLPPVKKKSPAGIVALVLGLIVVVIGGGVFALMQSGLMGGESRPTESVEKVATAFLDAKKNNDYDTCKPYLSEASIEKLNSTIFNSKQAQSAGFGTKESSDMLLFSQDPAPKNLKLGGAVSVKELKTDKEADNQTAIVKVHVDGKTNTPVGEGPVSEEAAEAASMWDVGPVDCELVFIAEGGKWKYDVEETERRAAGEPKKKKGFF